MIWAVITTVLLTVLAIVLAANFKTPEKALERKLEHRYAVADPQFRREMGVMLGPVEPLGALPCRLNTRQYKGKKTH